MRIANPLGVWVAGIGLFLFGMGLMTDRLRLAAGAEIRAAAATPPLMPVNLAARPVA